ncbi:MAG: hypothetical protein ACK4N5_09040 [Myxococcales bacterium]
MADQAKKAMQQLLGALESMEWAGPSSASAPNGTCLFCRRSREAEHTEVCPVVSAFRSVVTLHNELTALRKHRKATEGQLRALAAQVEKLQQSPPIH